MVSVHQPCNFNTVLGQVLFHVQAALHQLSFKHTVADRFEILLNAVHKILMGIKQVGTNIYVKDPQIRFSNLCLMKPVSTETVSLCDQPQVFPW